MPAVLLVSFPAGLALLDEGVAALLLMHVAVAVIAVTAYLKVMPLCPAR